MKVRITETRTVIVDVSDDVMKGFDSDDDHPYRVVEAIDNWVKRLGANGDNASTVITWSVEG